MQLKRIIEENDTTAGKTFDFFIQFLIVFSLVSFSIETLPDLSVNTKIILNIAEVITVAIFTIEYLLRLYFVSELVFPWGPEVQASFGG